MPSFKCKDIGFKDDPFAITTATKDELMQEVALHARTAHNMEVTPELKQAVEGAIKP